MGYNKSGDLMLYEKIKSRIVIVCGHYGAGKTNVAVNIAKEAAKAGRRVCIVDMDIVNPYFRAADNKTELEALGVRCILPRFANTNVDLPSLPPELQSVFYSDEFAIIDVGGDDGAVALSTYKARFIECGYDMLYVYNKSRPLTAELSDAIESLEAIEAISGLKFSGVVNNTNLGVLSNADCIRKSTADAKSLAEHFKLPLLCNCLIKDTDADGITDIMYIENATKKLF